MVIGVLAGERRKLSKMPRGDQRPRWSAEILMPPCFMVVIDRYEDARKLENFLNTSSGQLRVSLYWTGTSGLACHLRVIPLTDGDVGHYDKKLSSTSPLVIFDRPCNAEGLNILPWSHEFSKLCFMRLNSYAESLTIGVGVGENLDGKEAIETIF